MIERMLESAKAVALSSQGVGGRNKNAFRIGAVLFDKSGILSASTNSYKTHPFLARYTAFPYVHAESGCILRAGLDRAQGASVAVARVLRNGDLAMAKPCPVCTQIMQDAGVRSVFFSSGPTTIEEVRF